MSTRTSYVIAVMILLMGAGLRLWDTSTLPMGMHQGEITNIRLSETIRNTGIISVFYDITGNGEGQEGLFHISQAIMTTFMGSSGTMLYRLLSQYVGILLLPMIFTLGIRIFGRLAGLLSMGLLAFTMWPILLSSQIMVETVIPLMIVSVMLALARALPVYRFTPDENTVTSAFAAVGILLGLTLYIDPIGLSVTLASMIFIVYVLFVNRPLPRRSLSFIGFAILLLIIISVPYFLSTYRLPELAATTRYMGSYNGLINSIIQGFGAFFFVGDPNPVTNLPGRPMFNGFVLIFVIIGLLVSLRNIRAPRFGLPLIMLVVLLPTAVLRSNPTDFFRLTYLVPSIALLFGLGGASVIKWSKTKTPLLKNALIILIVGIIGFEGVTSLRDYFIEWPQRKDVQNAYMANLGQIAAHLDRTVNSIPTVFCVPDLKPLPRPTLRRWQLIQLMMNNTTPMRVADCRNAFIFANGGEREQIVITQADIIDNMQPQIKRWFDESQPLDAFDLPENSIFIFDNPEMLANQLGVYTTTTPATYSIEATNGVGEPIPPPIRFGGNITWLGYQRNDLDITYRAGQNVAVTTYWRIEGIPPTDLVIFNHLLTDPVTIASNRDVIHINPRTIRERDVFVQVTEIALPETILPGNYDVSVGVYQSTSNERLPVFEGSTVRGERIILYNITVEARPE